MPLSQGVRRDLAAWLGDEADPGGARGRYAAPRCDRVLVKWRGAAARGLALNRGLRTLCERAGVARVSLHCLRHSIATHLVAAGMALEAVGHFLGHRSLESTLTYVRVAEELAERELGERGAAAREGQTQAP